MLMQIRVQQIWFYHTDDRTISFIVYSWFYSVVNVTIYIKSDLLWRLVYLSEILSMKFMYVDKLMSP